MQEMSLSEATFRDGGAAGLRQLAMLQQAGHSSTGTGSTPTTPGGEDKEHNKGGGKTLVLGMLKKLKPAGEMWRGKKRDTPEDVPGLRTIFSRYVELSWSDAPAPKGALADETFLAALGGSQPPSPPPGGGERMVFEAFCRLCSELGVLHPKTCPAAAAHMAFHSAAGPATVGAEGKGRGEAEQAWPWLVALSYDEFRAAIKSLASYKNIGYQQLCRIMIVASINASDWVGPSKGSRRFTVNEGGDIPEAPRDSLRRRRRNSFQGMEPQVQVTVPKVFAALAVRGCLSWEQFREFFVGAGLADDQPRGAAWRLYENDGAGVRCPRSFEHVLPLPFVSLPQLRTVFNLARADPVQQHLEWRDFETALEMLESYLSIPVAELGERVIRYARQMPVLRRRLTLLAGGSDKILRVHEDELEPDQLRAASTDDIYRF